MSQPPAHHLPAMPPGAPRPEDYTDAERRNLGVVHQYMKIAYDPKEASADAVRHLVAADATFEAHTTFPEAHDPLTYAQEHGGARARCNAGRRAQQPCWGCRRARWGATAVMRTHACCS